MEYIYTSGYIIMGNCITIVIQLYIYIYNTIVCIHYLQFNLIIIFHNNKNIGENALITTCM